MAQPRFLETDFASAAMLRLIGLGLKRQGIAWPVPTPAAVYGAHVPLGDKRRLLDALLRQHGAGALLRIGERGRWRVQGAPGDAACWRLGWQPRVPAPPPPAAEHADWVGARLLQHDPARGWTLQALASDMHCSARSLQRHLAAQGSGFGLLFRQVRLARSARLLAESPQSPAQIGCLCGFSDQAHFTREFERHTAFTPARFREQFDVAR